MRRVFGLKVSPRAVRYVLISGYPLTLTAIARHLIVYLHIQTWERFQGFTMAILHRAASFLSSCSW